MFCEQCGKEISDGAKFCSGCGSPVEKTETQKEENDQTVLLTPYEVFGLPVETSTKNVKKAYKEALRKYSDDDSDSAKKKLEILDFAYSLISNGLGETSQIPIKKEDLYLFRSNTEMLSINDQSNVENESVSNWGSEALKAANKTRRSKIFAGIIAVLLLLADVIFFMSSVKYEVNKKWNDAYDLNDISEDLATGNLSESPDGWIWIRIHDRRESGYDKNGHYYITDAYLQYNSDEYTYYITFENDTEDGDGSIMSCWQKQLKWDKIMGTFTEFVESFSIVDNTEYKLNDHSMYVKCKIENFERKTVNGKSCFICTAQEKDTRIGIYDDFLFPCVLLAIVQLLSVLVMFKLSNKYSWWICAIGFIVSFIVFTILLHPIVLILEKVITGILALIFIPLLIGGIGFLSDHT